MGVTKTIFRVIITRKCKYGKEIDGNTMAEAYAAYRTYKAVLANYWSWICYASPDHRAQDSAAL